MGKSIFNLKVLSNHFKAQTCYVLMHKHNLFIVYFIWVNCDLFSLNVLIKNIRNPRWKSYLRFCSSIRFCEGCGSTRLLGPRSGHYPVPPVLQNLHRSHVQTPLQGLWTGRVWPLLHTHQACTLQRLGPPSQSVWPLSRPHRQPVTALTRITSWCAINPGNGLPWIINKNTVNPTTAPGHKGTGIDGLLDAKNGHRLSCLEFYQSWHRITIRSCLTWPFDSAS